MEGVSPWAPGLGPWRPTCRVVPDRLIAEMRPLPLEPRGDPSRRGRRSGQPSSRNATFRSPSGPSAQRPSRRPEPGFAESAGESSARSPMPTSGLRPGPRSMPGPPITVIAPPVPFYRRGRSSTRPAFRGSARLATQPQRPVPETERRSPALNRPRGWRLDQVADAGLGTHVCRVVDGNRLPGTPALGLARAGDPQRVDSLLRLAAARTRPRSPRSPCRQGAVRVLRPDPKRQP